ncbi:hypothetical protein BH10PSE12_BH10PSE12_15710 [soil metagenome]
MILKESRQRIIDRNEDTLSIEDIESLACGDILACRIRGFYDVATCRVIEQRVSAATATRYAVALNVEKLGMALFEATSDELLEDYYADAARAGDRAQALYSGHDDPIERLRSILDRLWPAGCDVEQLHDRPMYAGLVRIIGRHSELRPHQDNTNWDMTSSVRAQTMRTQFSCNVYFRVPEKGGELELWETRIDDESLYRGMRVTGDYSLDRVRIGRPTLIVPPGCGDLIVFDARRIHAVAKVVQGSRINASTFIGLRGADSALTLFS